MKRVLCSLLAAALCVTSCAAAVNEHALVYNCGKSYCPGHELQYLDREPEVCPDSFTIDLSFAGDCTLATNLGAVYQNSFSWYAAHYDPSYFLEGVYDIFSTDDFTVVNLENVLTDRNLPALDKGEGPAFWFKAPTSNVNILTAGSVEAVSLANNHTYDYGAGGYQDTIAAVERAGLEYGTDYRTFYLTKNGFTIAVICNGLWYEGQAAQIASRIREASQYSDYQVVFFHGGEEAVHEPEAWKVRAAHALVDAGADLVIGNHPHVLQPEEVYHGVHILYSIGNFCFGGHAAPRNRTVIYKLVLTVADGQLLSEQVEAIPCYVYTGSVNNWHPAPITDEAEKQRVLEFLAGQRSLPY